MSEPPSVDVASLPALPRDWSYVALEDLLEANGISYGIVQPGNHDPAGIPIVRVKDLKAGQVNREDPLQVSSEVEEKYSRTRLKGGEVLVSLVGSVGETAVATSELTGWNVARAIGVLRVSGQVTASWLKICLEGEVAQHYMQTRLNTTVQATLNLRDVRRIPIVMPPERERLAIAAVVAALDDKIAVNERLATTAQRLMQARYLQAINNELIEKPLGDVVEFHNRKRVPLSSRQRSEIPGPYPYYGAAGVVGHIRDFIFSGPHLLVGEDGSVMTSDRKPMTQYVWGDFWVNNHAHILTGKEFSTELLAVALQFTDVAALVTGAVQPKLNMRNLMRLEVPLPIGERLATLDGEIREVTALVRRRSDESRAITDLREALLPQLMSGKLRVRDAEKIVEDAV